MFSTSSHSGRTGRTCTLAEASPRPISEGRRFRRFRPAMSQSTIRWQASGAHWGVGAGTVSTIRSMQLREWATIFTSVVVSLPLMLVGSRSRSIGWHATICRQKPGARSDPALGMGQTSMFLHSRLSEVISTPVGYLRRSMREGRRFPLMVSPGSAQRRTAGVRLVSAAVMGSMTLLVRWR